MMIKAEADEQVDKFFKRLGQDSSFSTKNAVQARIGEAVVGFEYDAETTTLSAQALIYRFRSEPKDAVLDAVFAAETDANNGGGRLVFNSENRAFYLQRDFTEKVGEQVFHDIINKLAQASFRWHSEILMNAAEKAAA